MGRPREHDETTGEALLDAAEVLLAKGGPDVVSVRGVADAVGTSTRAVYTVFGSKAGLVQGLATRGYRLLTNYVAGLPTTDDPAADLVAVGLLGFRRFALERPQLFRLTFERVPAGITTNPTVGAAAMASYEALATSIRRAKAATVLGEWPDAEIAFVFHAVCQGLASSELSRQPPPVGAGFWRHARDLDADQLWRIALEALIAGLAQRPAAEKRHARSERR